MAYRGEIGEGIRVHRVRLGLDAKDVAQSAMVATPLYVKLEQGTARATPWVLERIAQVLAVSVAELVTGCVEVERGPVVDRQAADREAKGAKLVTAAELGHLERMIQDSHCGNVDYVNELIQGLQDRLDRLVRRVDRLDRLARRLDRLERVPGGEDC